MISFELKKLLRDHQWKYLPLILAGAVLYHLLYYNDLPLSTGTGLFSVMDHRQLVASIAAFPCFLLLYLLYRIAHQLESYATWKTELAFHMDPRKHLLASMAALALFQPFILAIGCGIYYVYMHAIDLMLIRFLITLQIAYYVCYFYYTFLVKSGIMSEGMNVSVVNPLRSLSPIFLLCCILNMGDWMDVFSVALMPMAAAMVLMMGAMLYNCNYWMRVKLHRELILSKLFSGVANPRTEHMKANNKKQFDAALQAIFRFLPFHSPGYWRFVAVFEVSIKQKGYPLLLMLACIILLFTTGTLIFLGFAVLFAGYFCIFFYHQKQMFQKVSIHKK